MTNKENEILNNVKEWTRKYMGPSFTFREYQESIIVGIISNCLGEGSNYETLVLEAPTGSGKSLLCLISAGVLAEYYDMPSYILCSDLYLYKQYEDVIKASKLPFGMLKGSRNNYRCHVVDNDLQFANCKLWKVPMKDILSESWCEKSKWFGCANNCEYIKDYRSAIRSNVTLLTYQLWLNFMNHDSQTFSKRHVIFCDECHNIPNIIQMYAQPTIYPKYNTKVLKDVLEYAIKNDFKIEQYGYRQLHNEDNTLFVEDDVNETGIYVTNYNVDEMLEDFMKHFNDLYCHEDKKDIYDDLLKIKDIYLTIKGCALKAQDYIKTNKEDRKKVKLISVINHAIELYNTLSTYLNAVMNCADTEDGAIKYIVKNTAIDAEHERSCILTCSKEDTLSSRYLLDKAPKKIMLSATVGLFESFCDNIGLKNEHSSTQEFRIPSTFDFSKSPIYYSTRLSMNHQNITKNMPEMANMINKIITSERYKNVKGIIHTGSYKNTYALMNLLPYNVKKRIHIYKDSQDKNQVLQEFKDSTNGILIGPTLVEGIDLPEEHCRFMIIMKIPYPNLGDKLVKSKMELFPNWYYSETSNTIIQAIGRGNRTPSDYCETFILDNSFMFIYNKTKAQYPESFIHRLRQIN